MVATSPTQTRARYQWEADSTDSPRPDPGNAPFNCGPASVAKIIEFYRDTNVNVNAVRRSSGVGDLRPTNVSQQKVMLEKYGVSCDIASLTLAQVKSAISSGRRPILVGMLMSRVPASMRDHPFLGAHAVVLLANQTRNGVSGILVMDPNFSPRTGRLDPDKGVKFYTDAVVSYAMASTATQRWCVVPRAAKKISVPAPVPTPPAETTTQVGGLPVTFTANRKGWKANIKAGKPRRSGAILASSNFGSTTKEEGMIIWGEVKGQDLSSYGLPGGTRWFFGPQWIGKDRVVYVPYADLTDRNF